MAYTLRNLVKDALFEIRVIGVDEDPEDDEMETGVRYAIAMAETFNADRLMLSTVDRQVYALAAGQATRTLGPAGQWVGARPQFISELRVIPVGADEELEMHPYTEAEYQAEYFKAQTGSYPTAWIAKDTSPESVTFTFWRVPETAAEIVVYAAVPLTTVMTENTVLTFRPGHKEMWKLNLALRLCRPNGQPRDPDLVQEAKDAMSLAKRNNDPGPPPSRSDSALTGRGFDILSNRFTG